MKPLEWAGSSQKDLARLPRGVQREFGFALYLAQLGMKADNAKPLKGFKGAGVLEVVETHHGDAFRAIYTVRYAHAVYVLHVFQKKSKSGIATPASDMALVSQRLKDIESRLP